MPEVSYGERPLPPPNLFTPDFGQVPHVLVGRDGLTGSLVDGLRAGPTDGRFTTLLLGPRGAGKTVMLNAMRDIVSGSGWIVLPVDASTHGIAERVAEYIEWAQDTHEDLPAVSAGDRDERSSAKVRILPFEWQREVVRSVRPRWGLRRQLSVLADHAAARDSAVLLSVDELHSGHRDELRRLAADLQHITKNEGRHLAFMGAGLSVMKHTVLEDKKMTFLQRCHREDMPPITTADAARFLAKVVSDAGGQLAPEVLGILAEASAGLAFRMQSVGHFAWHVAGAPLRPIDEAAARLAVSEADRSLHERVSVPVWHDLSAKEQGFLRVLAALGGEAHPRRIAQMLCEAPRTLARIEEHLSNAGCVTVGEDGCVEIGDVISARSVQIMAEREARYGEAPEGAEAEPAGRPAARPRCNAFMPRAQARCILPPDHAGGCRSC